MANVKASDNPFPSILIKEETEPAAPAAGHQRVYIDSTTHVPMIVNSSGTETPLGASVADILDLPTAETDDTLVLAPDGAGGVEFRAEAGGSGGIAVLDYVQRTTDLSITGTNEAGADTFLTGSSVTYDGSTPVLVEFFSPDCRAGTTGGAIVFLLYDGATVLGRIGVWIPAASTGDTARGSYRLTPSAGSHQYIIKVYGPGSGSPVAGAGSGGTGTALPAYMRISSEISVTPPATPLPGYEYDYAQITSPVSVTATAEASANTVVSGASVAYDGATVVLIEFWAPWWNPDTTSAGNFIALYLYDGSTSLGRIGLRFNQVAAVNNHGPVSAARRLTPSNASHTYSIRAIVSAGTGTVQAGAAGSGNDNPAFIRITKVA